VIDSGMGNPSGGRGGVGSPWKVCSQDFPQKFGLTILLKRCRVAYRRPSTGRLDNLCENFDRFSGQKVRVAG
jgi:hypothetical protein